VPTHTLRIPHLLQVFYPSWLENHGYGGGKWSALLYLASSQNFVFHFPLLIVFFLDVKNVPFIAPPP